VKRAALVWIAAVAALVIGAQQAPPEFRFALIGDRTGEAQPGVWERVWREAAAAKPAFFLSVGDLIQGQDDAKAEAEWRGLDATLDPYRRFPLHFAPGNHDVWNDSSARLYAAHTGRALHYGFYFAGAHFTVLDNSRGDALTASELEFLEADLSAHKSAAAKFLVMHRPSWITGAALHPIVKRHGVRWVIAGHVHQLIHAEFDGVTYYAVPSAGGHLRLSGKYEDGWFFGWTEVAVSGANAAFTVHELGGRATPLEAWGMAGLRAQPPTSGGR